MVRSSIEHAKMPHNNNISKYEDLYIDNLFWTIRAVFGRFCYGKLYNLCIEDVKNFILLYLLLQLISKSLSFFMVLYSVR